MNSRLLNIVLPWSAVGIALLRGLGELVVLQRWRLREAMRAPRRTAGKR